MQFPLDCSPISLPRPKLLPKRITTKQRGNRLFNLDYQFHRQIAESAGNPWLTALLDQVFDKMRLLRVQTTRHNPKALDICAEHRKIRVAIAPRSPDVAQQSVQAHLEASRERVIYAIATLHSGADPADAAKLSS
ncbi:MAG: GntR family transcriptional regulator [Leptolyngbyaceae cyanobacterium T60_A2020_046]|nr:GntR family transcriptional regulator [Leptolyngbyaceae cyanobacterium T60_A2020_046]